MPEEVQPEPPGPGGGADTYCRHPHKDAKALADLGAGLRLLRGLQDLEPTLIPQSWIE